MTKTKFQCEFDEISNQQKQDKKQYELELSFYAGEIQNLKEVIMKLKGDKGRDREREGGRGAELLDRKMEELLQTISFQDETIATLRDERTALMVEMLTHKERKVSERSGLDL